ncbi:TIGR02452 family protein [Gorillibacterium sp. sgz5001074]|uniref:TIGR02452 family protein n=1 Tax=Gorillibacterium sp. sgz5001074 TaxID=3446695 RepID=UPI003F67EECF
MNAPINNREIRSQFAKETLDIVSKGFYLDAERNKVTIEYDVELAVRGSKLYSPDVLYGMKEVTVTRLGHERGELPRIEVTDESTLVATKRLVQKEGIRNTLCLNFASAKNPGGGFLGGSQAQEESLARSSGLYPCISQMDEMYSYNRSLKTCFYSDYMIYSPNVPVFRDDAGGLLNCPYLVSMITAPAVNAGVVREREPDKVKMIEPVMLERMRYILSVAAHHGAKGLVLGAFGCGVFKNNPSDISRMFKHVLIDEQYGTLFDRIVFAILDKTDGKKTFNAFKSGFCLGGSPD